MGELELSDVRDVLIIVTEAKLCRFEIRYFFTEMPVLSIVGASFRAISPTNTALLDALQVLFIQN
jgi:hypothetical protein